MGIGHPGEKELVMPHVLGDFHKAEQPWLVKSSITAGRSPAKTGAKGGLPAIKIAKTVLKLRQICM